MTSDTLGEAEAPLTTNPPGAASAWRPIETAPRDGTKVLCFSPGNRKAGNENAQRKYFRIDDLRKGLWWRMYPEAPYTHWQPLPAPPATAEGSGDE